MGICISYKGSLSDPSRLEEAIAEVKKFCVRAAWRCEDWEEHVSGMLLPSRGRAKPKLIEEDLRGVYVCPPETESLRLVFDSKGRLAHYLELLEEMVREPIPGAVHYIAMPMFCKTTGCPVTHMRLCLMLRLLEVKYMPNLKVQDDTNYWKTGNFEKLCREHFAMASFIQSMSDPKRATELLRSLGVDLGEGEIVEVLDPSIPIPRPAKKKAKGAVN